jgi:leader peptidase (prepilin peptidase)/N-methyltransferase
VVLLASIQGTVVGLALIALGKSEPGPPEPPETAAPPPGPGALDPAGTAPATPAAEPAPDDGVPPAPADPDADWIPPRNAVPFGPFLAAGALEWLWLQGWLSELVPALSIFR